MKQTSLFYFPIQNAQNEFQLSVDKNRIKRFENFCFVKFELLVLMSIVEAGTCQSFLSISRCVYKAAYYDHWI